MKILLYLFLITVELSAQITQIPGGGGGGAPTGAAGGDLSGTYPNPTVAKLNGSAVGAFTGIVRGAAGTFTASELSGDATTSGSNVVTIKTNQKIRSFSGTFSGALASGQTVYTTIPYACTISAYNIVADTGTTTIKVWRLATGTAIPTVSNTISTNGVSLATGTAIHSTTVSDFTNLAISANDILGINLFAVSGATYVNVVFECDAT